MADDFAFPRVYWLVYWQSQKTHTYCKEENGEKAKTNGRQKKQLDLVFIGVTSVARPSLGPLHFDSLANQKLSIISVCRDISVEKSNRYNEKCRWSSSLYEWPKKRSYCKCVCQCLSEKKRRRKKEGVRIRLNDFKYSRFDAFTPKMFIRILLSAASIASLIISLTSSLHSIFQ